MKSRTGHPRGGFGLGEQKIAYLFILPPLILFLIFMVIPTVMALYLSLTNYDVIQAPKFVGVRNFVNIVHDPYFFVALRNTFYYVLVYVPLGLLTALGAALLLNKRKFGTKLFRTCFYLPVLSSSIATATIWLWLLNPQYGLINTMLSWFGINGPAWLASSDWAMIAIIIMSVWAGFGGNMMIYLAGLQGVPDYLYEAAKLDGANTFQMFWYVTMPALGSTTFLVSTMLCIGAFQMFDQAYLLTQGGPGNATVTLVYYIYNTGFGSLNMGYASALSVVLFVLIFIFSLLNMKVNSNSVEY